MSLSFDEAHSNTDSALRDTGKGNFPLVGRGTDIFFHGSLHWFGVEKKKNSLVFRFLALVLALVSKGGYNENPIFLTYGNSDPVL